MCFPIIAISRKDGGFVLKMGCKGADRLQKVDFWHFLRKESAISFVFLHRILDKLTKFGHKIEISWVLACEKGLL